MFLRLSQQPSIVCPLYNAASESKYISVTMELKAITIMIVQNCGVRAFKLSIIVHC